MKNPQFPVLFDEGPNEKVTQPKKVVPWMRVLKVRLYNDHTSFLFGEKNEDNICLSMSVEVFKYVGTLKDTAVIKIENLTYKQMIQIIAAKIYNVEVECGYQSSGSTRIFKGQVLYIGNSLNQDRTNTVTIMCGSELMSKFAQSRLNLSFRSNINLYSALRFVCNVAGIRNASVSQDFKNATVGLISSVNETPGSWINRLANANQQMVVTSDSSLGSTFSMFKANNSGIKFRIDPTDLCGGYPKLTSQGLSFSIFPTMTIRPGDTVLVDNSLIDISSSSYTDPTANYLDLNGRYIVEQVSYNLQNRGQTFTLQILARAQSSFVTELIK